MRTYVASRRTGHRQVEHGKTAFEVADDVSWFKRFAKSVGEYETVILPSVAGQLAFLVLSYLLGPERVDELALCGAGRGHRSARGAADESSMCDPTLDPRR